MKLFIITTVLALLASSNLESVAANKVRGSSRHLDDEGDGVTVRVPISLVTPPATQRPREAIPATIPDGDDIDADYTLTDCGIAKCPRGYICDIENSTPGAPSGNPMCVPCGNAGEPCCDDETVGTCALSGLYCDRTQDGVGTIGSPLVGAGMCITAQPCGFNSLPCCPGWECYYDLNLGIGLEEQVCDIAGSLNSGGGCQSCGHTVGAPCCVDENSEFVCGFGLVCDTSGGFGLYQCKSNVRP